MSIYKLIEATNGTRYTKDKRFIKKSDIPEDILKQLELGKDVSTVRAHNGQCLFCGIPSRLTRAVNGEVVVLCDTHFYSETIGKIAQELRTQNERQIQAT